MAKEYISIVLKLCSLGFIIAAAGLWAGAGVDNRPKYRDDQTLIGGTIWSQLIIPIGLLLSYIAKERLDSFIHAYFLAAGVGLCLATGIVLILDEVKAMNSPLRSIESRLNIRIVRYNRVYLSIGIFSLLAGIVNILITGLLAFGAYWTTKYLMTMPANTNVSDIMSTTPSHHHHPKFISM